MTTVLERFELGSDAWLKDPRRAAPVAMLQLGEAGQLLAEAQYDLAIVKAEMLAFVGTTMAALASKYAKWPKWRIDAVVHAEPKFRYWSIELAKREQDVVLLEIVVFTLKQRLALLGDFYES